MSTLKIPVGTTDHIQGPVNAPLTLVEYGDYECPYCGTAYFVVKELQDHFGDQLKFIFRNFPLAEMHPFAEISAEAAEFADTHNRFWDMHDGIYQNQHRLSVPLLMELAAVLKLPPDGFEEALETRPFAEKIRKDFMGGVRSGVNGTPSFFINDHKYSGPYEIADMIQALQSVLV